MCIRDRIEIELSKAYLYRALRCEDSDSDCIYCLANVYLAVLYYTTRQYQTAIDHCTLVMRSQDHSQCSSHVVQGELLPKTDDGVDIVLGLAVFYQHVRMAALNQQQQPQHVTMFTTELFAHYLHIKCLPVSYMSLTRTVFLRYWYCLLIKSCLSANELNLNLYIAVHNISGVFRTLARGAKGWAPKARGSGWVLEGYPLPLGRSRDELCPLPRNFFKVVEWKWRVSMHSGTLAHTMSVRSTCLWRLCLTETCWIWMSVSSISWCRQAGSRSSWYSRNHRTWWRDNLWMGLTSSQSNSEPVVFVWRCPLHQHKHVWSHTETNFAMLSSQSWNKAFIDIRLRPGIATPLVVVG